MQTAVIERESTEELSVERSPTGHWSWICGALIAAVVLCLATNAVFDQNFIKNINDGVAYLDISHAVAAHHPEALLNAYWSPGYPVVLWAGLALLHPPPELELAAVYAIHWVVGILALGCLIYFVAGLPAAREKAGAFGLTRPMLVAAGCALFVIAAEADVPVYLLTPDLLLAAWLWLAGGALLRIGRRQRIRDYALLALALAAAYFTKAVGLPLVMAALAILPLLGANRRKAVLGILHFMAVAAILIVPYMAKLSAAKGRVTFGESGTLNYAWIVDGADGPNRWHLQSDSPHGHARMQLAHPARQLLKSPGVYEYASPVAGTFPTFDDPSYWNEGLRPTFYLKGQVWHIAMNLYHTASWLGRRGEFVIALAVLLWMQRQFGAAGRLREILPVLLWFTGLWGLYLLVDVEDRYVFAALTAILLLAAASVRLPDSSMMRRVVSAGVLILVCGAMLRPLDTAGQEVFYGVKRMFIGPVKAKAFGPYENPYWKIAQRLTGRMGLHASDQVACMQLGCDNTYWAQLAGLRITADISSESDYWAASPEDRARAMAALAGVGVKALVTRNLGPGAESEGWIPISDPHERPAEDL